MNLIDVEEAELYSKKKIKLFFGILILILISFSIVGGCGGGSDNKETDPESPPAADDGGGGAGTVGEGGGTGGGGSNPPETGTGEIRGSVVSSTGTPLNGVHVRAVNIDDTSIQIASFSGIGTNLSLVDGAFSIQNVPPGDYRVLIEEMDDRNSVFDPDRYSAFVIMEATNLNFPDEYYNGVDESSTDVTTDFITITVTNGSTVSGINFITNN